MAKIYTVQNSFTGGEITPKVLGRTDLGSYDSSVKEMVNCYPFVYGGVTRRKGFKFVDLLPKSNSFAPKMIKFVYSRTESYLLVAHGSNFLFIKDGDIVESGGLPVSLAMPYLDSELEDIRYAQQGNVLILVHPNHPPKRLARISDTNWTLSDISFVSYAVTDSWFKTAYIDLKIVSDSDIDTKFNVGDYWEWTSLGSTITVDPALKDSADAAIASPPGACVITSVNSGDGNGIWRATCVYSDADRQEWQVRTPNGNYPTLTWTNNNYPQTVTFYQQRLWFGGSPNDPQTLWASAVDEPDNFTVGSLDDDALKLTISSAENSDIIHLTTGANALLPLTYSVEYAVSSTAGALTPFNRSIAAQTTHGTNSVRPIHIGSDTIFVERSGLKVRSIYFDLNQSQNKAEDITLMAEHITGTGITDLAFAQEPYPVLWAVREDGTLLTGTYDRAQSISGWAKHNVDGLVKSVAVLPQANKDTVYIIVERTINGLTEWAVEVLGEENLDHYVKASDSTAKSVWPNFWTFSNEEVSVIADGMYYGEVTVSATGEITLNSDVNEVIVGKKFNNYVTLLHPNLNANGQNLQGRVTSVDKLSIRFEDTVGSYVQTASGKTTILPFTKFNQTAFSTPIEPYSGDKTINVSGWSDDNTITIGQSFPYDWTLLAVIMRVTANDM